MKPTYSVIIPAFNEELLLPRTLAMLERAMERLSFPGEVIVVDNNSSDRTAEIARERGARVVHEPENQISRARNTGARAALGDYLMFLDADTLPTHGLIGSALTRLLSGNWAGGGAIISFRQDSLPGEAPRNSWAHMLAPVLARFLADHGICGGSFIFCTRAAFEAVGGFSEKVYAAEDVVLSRALRDWGRQNGKQFEVLMDTSIRSSDRKLRWHSPLRLTLILCLFAVFPWAIRSRARCHFWYERPS